MITMRKLPAGDFSALLRWRIRHSVLIISLIAMGIACNGKSGDGENQQSVSENEVQQSEDQKGTQTMYSTLQQYVNASSRDEALKAQKAWIADLKKRYGGIDASVFGPDARTHSLRFTKLMREWNPILCKADDLKSIAGKPTSASSSLKIWVRKISRHALASGF